MKTFFLQLGLILSILSILPQRTVAQTDYKYGKITMEELLTNSYEPDTSAVAVYLYKKGETSFTYMNHEFGLLTEFSSRIKILKSDGKSYADISIPFFVSDSPQGIKEKITNINATAYNLVNGKIEKSELSKKYIFEEKGAENWRLMKFSIPNVKEGTIIEYKYTYRSSSPFHIDSWKMQESIPVDYAQYQATIPEYFGYTYETKGYEKVDFKQESANQTFYVSDSNTSSDNAITVLCSKVTFSGKELPAIKEEPFLWCLSDYQTDVEFELNNVQFPGGNIQSYASDWGKAKKTLKNYDKFGKYLQMRDPFAQEIKTIKLEGLTSEEKIRTLFTYLKRRIKWNGDYDLFGEKPQECIKQGSGTNADINFIFMAMLRDAGIKSTPVLIRTRHRGRLPMRATVDKLNTFIVAAYTPEGDTCYIDGSIDKGDINILPPSLMVTQGVLFDDSEKTNFIDLSQLGKNTMRYNITATIKEDGTFTGKRDGLYGGQNAVLFRSAVGNEKDSIDSMRKTEEKYNINITGCQTRDTHILSNRCIETIDFSGELPTNDDYIYVNPMLFPDESKNPFTNAGRKFPVEFPYMQSVIINTLLTLPEGFEIEELPQSIKMVLNNKEVSMTYAIRQEDNRLRTQYNIMIHTPLILPESYSELRNFWEELVNKNNQQIVLKKVTPQP